jgi:hypothetical protein
MFSCPYPPVPGSSTHLCLCIVYIGDVNLHHIYLNKIVYSNPFLHMPPIYSVHYINNRCTKPQVRVYLIRGEEKYGL